MIQSFLITGASTGIGRASALRLDHLGHNVFAGVRKDSDARSLLQEGSDHLCPIQIEVTDADSIERARAEVATHLGNRGLNGLVNNAGIAVGGPLEALTLDEIRHQFEVNVFGQIAVTQAFLPLLRRAKEQDGQAGRIVNMSSMAGKIGQPLVGPYCASKHALEAITDSLRRELVGQGVFACAIEPGVIQTPIWEKGQAAAAEKIDRLEPEMEALYGDAVHRLRKALDSISDKGVPAEEVAKAVEHALTARRPKLRYPVGRDAKISIAMARWLPGRWFDRLIATVAKRI